MKICTRLCQIFQRSIFEIKVNYESKLKHETNRFKSKTRFFSRVENCDSINLSTKEF